jgi:hypothetical protein
MSDDGAPLVLMGNWATYLSIKVIRFIEYIHCTITQTVLNKPMTRAVGMQQIHRATTAIARGNQRLAHRNIQHHLPGMQCLQWSSSNTRIMFSTNVSCGGFSPSLFQTLPNFRTSSTTTACPTAPVSLRLSLNVLCHLNEEDDGG